jgi:PadR family transcriptional regulator, regulatory protein PadR
MPAGCWPRPAGCNQIDDLRVLDQEGNLNRLGQNEGHNMNVVAGTLELLVLQTLSNGAQLHGFEVLDVIREATGEALVIEEGALYPALHRLERKGWLSSEWAVSERGRRAKYYRLTAKGRAALVKQQAEWDRYVWAMARVAEHGRNA